MSDPDYDALSASVHGLAETLCSLNQRAVREYGPVVEAIIRSRSRDTHHIEHTIESRHLLVSTDGGVRTFPVTLRYAWPSELDLMARLAGLRFRDRWSSWSRSPFTRDSAKHVSVYTRSE